ncbi:hypothetical protein L6452_18431 [Arctium lappa]|uniref:Uncharacterized protein n=1 Tax=Arctium lappa TaxID=4217 RepID=A0ACB9C6B7_ARCLA|nr:hypothetical protein L6452_18431 [Arctium lappa]
MRVMVLKKKGFCVGGGGSSSTSLQSFPLADKAQTCSQVPVELAKEAVKVYHTTLYGYFLGPHIPFLVVQRYMMNANGIFFFRFNDEGGSNQVVEAGPLMLHNIPLVAFNREGVSRIDGALGCTETNASMCDKAWGRPGFAKVVVEVWEVGDLNRELEVVLPNLNGGVDKRVRIGVGYLWEPLHWSHSMHAIPKEGGEPCVECVKPNDTPMETLVDNGKGGLEKEKEKGNEVRLDKSEKDALLGNPVHIKSPTMTSVVKTFLTIKKPVKGPLTTGSNTFQVVANGQGEEVGDNTLGSISSKEVLKDMMEGDISQTTVSND